MHPAAREYRSRDPVLRRLAVVERQRDDRARSRPRPAATSTVHVRIAGDASAFPALSIARTENVCAPLASPECPRRGARRERAAVQAALERAGLGRAEVEPRGAGGHGSGGPPVIVVSGEVPSTVHAQIAGEDRPRRPVPRASAERVRSVRQPAYDIGVVQEAKAAPSRPLEGRTRCVRRQAERGRSRGRECGRLRAQRRLGAAPSITWRTVRTTVPVDPARGCSQSSSAANVLGFTQPSLHAVAQMPWKLTCTQPPPVFSACVRAPASRRA